MKNEAFNKLIQFGHLKQLEDTSFNMQFNVLRSSSVFDGHFPGQPILPGVVMVEMTKRTAEMALNRKLQLIEASNFKFLKMLDPDLVNQAEIFFEIAPKEEGWRVKSKIIFNNETYFKADGFYTSRS